MPWPSAPWHTAQSLRNTSWASTRGAAAAGSGEPAPPSHTAAKTATPTTTQPAIALVSARVILRSDARLGSPYPPWRDSIQSEVRSTNDVVDGGIGHVLAGTKQFMDPTIRTPPIRLTWDALGPRSEGQFVEQVLARCHAAGSHLDDRTVTIVVAEFLMSAGREGGRAVMEIEVSTDSMRLHVVDAMRPGGRHPPAGSFS